MKLQKGLGVFLVVISFAMCGDTQCVTSPMYFVGYWHNSPVFDCPQTHTLFIHEDGEEVLTSYPSEYSVLAVNDHFISFARSRLQGTDLVLWKDFKEFSVSLIKAPLSYSSLTDDGSVYYSDDASTPDVHVVADARNRDVPIHGYVIKVVDSLLFYTRAHDPELIRANADVFTYNLRSGLIARVLVDVSGECTIVDSGGRYVYEQVLEDGEFRPFLFDLVDKKDKRIEVSKEFLTTTPFYAPKKEVLVFYSPKSMEMVEISLMDGWSETSTRIPE